MDLNLSLSSVEGNPGPFGFTLLYFVIGLENSRRHLNQSGAKLSNNVTWSFAFSRHSSSVLVFIMSSHWLPMM